MPDRENSVDYCVVVDAIATANPRFAVRQYEAADFMLRTTGLSEPLRKRLQQVYERSGIERRFTCLEDYTRQFSDFEFYPRTPSLCPSPTTAARNAIYRTESVPLALESSAKCLSAANVTADQVTHLIVVTCTGFFAPGIDIQLVKQLGLPKNTHRTVIGFMGCYAAFNGFKAAAAICHADHQARVLLVCVELCTLHFQIADTLESVIVNALFSDGAAACLIRSRTKAEAAGKLIYRDAETLLGEGSLDAMSWEIGDSGFIMGLSSQVPELIAADLPRFVETLAGRNGLEVNDINHWAVHPGGRQVLDRTAAALQLSGDALAESYGVLRDYGNMSSPTILFILNRMMSRPIEDCHRSVMSLAFGPGLTIEGALFEFGSAQ